MITIWTWDGCPTCYIAKEILKENGIPFIDKRLGVDFTTEELMNALGKPDLPQFTENGTYIGNLEVFMNNIERFKGKQQ